MFANYPDPKKVHTLANVEKLLQMIWYAPSLCLRLTKMNNLFFYET
jgi:hypothetical protein